MYEIRKKTENFFTLFAERNLLGLSASIGFYLVLALTPFLLLLFTLTAVVGWGKSEEFRSAVHERLGSGAAIGLDAISQRLEADGGSLSLGLLGLLAILWSSSGVVGEIQDAINRVIASPATDPTPQPANEKSPSAIWLWLKMRGFAILVVISCVLVALASFGGTLALRWLIPGAEESFWQGLKDLGSFAVFALLFYAMFRLLPTKQPRPHFAVSAGLICSALFHVGNAALEFYFANSGFTTSYGALSSFIVLLLWAQYNGLIILISAAAAQVFFTTKRNPGLSTHRAGVSVDVGPGRLNNEAVKEY